MIPFALAPIDAGCRNQILGAFDAIDTLTGNVKTPDELFVLPEGVIFRTEDKEGNVYTQESDASCVDVPIAVLINDMSISAAEYFAAALQEYGVAMVIGDKTGGKGYAQNMFTLSDGSSVNISSYSYYTPKGKSLAETGITPDIEISLSEEDFYNFYYLTNEQDTQLQKALEYVKGQISE